MKRQKISACRLGASAIMISGIVATIIAAAITRLRPSTSAIAPANGAEIAIARIVAVIVRLISPGVAPNSRASDGSSDCGPYRLKNAQKPGMPTAARRRFWFMEDLGSWKTWVHKSSGRRIIGERDAESISRRAQLWHA